MTLAPLGSPPQTTPTSFFRYTSQPNRKKNMTAYSALTLTTALTTLSSFLYLAAAFSNEFSPSPSRPLMLAKNRGGSHYSHGELLDLGRMIQQCSQRVCNDVKKHYRSSYILWNSSFYRRSNSFAHCIISCCSEFDNSPRFKHKNNSSGNYCIIKCTILQRFGRYWNLRRHTATIRRIFHAIKERTQKVIQEATCLLLHQILHH